MKGFFIQTYNNRILGYMSIDFRGYRLLCKLENIVLALNPTRMDSIETIRHGIVGRAILCESGTDWIELESNQ